jgi:zinc transporter ZupT
VTFLILPYALAFAAGAMILWGRRVIPETQQDKIPILLQWDGGFIVMMVLMWLWGRNL